MDLMKSGKFAQLCHTTKNTLIHYDQIGLLHPSVKGENGYRYYTLRDFWRFQAISVFIQAGFRLSEIQELLANRNEQKLLKEISCTRASLEERKKQIEHSLDELAGMDYMIREAQDLKYGKPIVRQEPRRMLYFCGNAESLKPSASFDYGLVTKDSTETISILRDIEPRASVVPYGLTASYQNGEVKYNDMFFLLPYKARIVQKGRGHLVALEKGDFASLGFKGCWKNVSVAYRKLLAFAHDNKLTLKMPFYEISQFWPFDDEDNEYRCTVTAAVQRPTLL
ncbi:MAG: MerR family transcriptional regulator [Eggerthellaceae bacterium]|nr:MerR family transcriptional regulator [Eggerthellaceae bacterium]